MKILVTGGAGFIGSNFLNYMVKKYSNYEWICLDALTYAADLKYLSSIIDLNNFKFIHGNILDTDLIENLFKENKFDKVINFAAESDVDKSIQEPKIFIETNIIGTKNLLDACVKYKVKHFHQISTDEVYGDLGLNSNAYFNEKTPLNPSNPYAVSKASADMLVMSYVRMYNLFATISRCSNNYGPHQHKEKFIPMAITNLLNNNPICIHGDGLAIRDWIYVQDHVKAIDLIIHNIKNSGIYNIGGHCQKSVLEVGLEILKMMNKKKNMIQYIQERIGQDLKYAVDTKKIEKELNWKTEGNFKDDLKLTIDWYTTNYR